MSQTLQNMISQLNRLTLEEQWKLLGYLMNRLQSTVCLSGSWSGLKTSVNETEVNALLAETKGSWENRGIEEIDAELNRQRKMSWGE